MRILIAFLALLTAATTAGAQPSRNAVERDFRSWLNGEVRAEARAAGVSQQTFEAALGGVTLDWSLPDLRPPGSKVEVHEFPWQAEFRSSAGYFSEKRLNDLAIHGQRRLAKWRKTLNDVENRYGVPAEIVVAIWGRESSFGAVRLPENALRAIATQAFMGRRKTMYRTELIDALRIVEAHDVAPAKMLSSWAGAMGQPQFLPSVFHHYAVDFDGDGHRDIWDSTPDSLASIANFLRQEGWKPERGWGLEIALPASISCTLAGPEQGRPMAEWASLGVTAVNGAPLPVTAGRDGFLFLPAGRGGPAFIVTENFYTLKRYNFSDNYALYIGHLADRIEGANRPFKGGWTSTAGTTRGDVRRLQEHLISLGHDVGGADGLVGFRTRIAIGKWQAQIGLPQTCFPDKATLARVPR